MNNNGLISRQTAIDKLFEYAESKFQSGEIELANGILKAKCFLENPCNIPTAYDVDKVIAQLDEKIARLDSRQQICYEVGDFKTGDKMADKMAAFIESKNIVKREVKK